MELLTFIAVAAITAITAANANAIAGTSINAIAIVTAMAILPAAIAQADIDPVKFLLELALKAS
jgi:hypothetical protein